MLVKLILLVLNGIMKDILIHKIMLHLLFINIRLIIYTIFILDLNLMVYGDIKDMQEI